MSGGGWHRSPSGVIRRTLEAAFEDRVPFLASALSFDLLLTAIPFVVLVLGAVGQLVQHQITHHQVDVHEILLRFLPFAGGGTNAAVFDRAEQTLTGLIKSRGQLTWFGLPLFVWFSTRFFAGLRNALNEVFDSDEIRSWPVAKLTDLVMVIVTGALIVGGALLPVLRGRGGDVGGFALTWTYRFSLELVAFAFSTVLFFLMFEILPSRRLAWRTALVAAVFCALAFEAGKRLYGLYLGRFVTLDQVASNANVVALFLSFLWVYAMAYVFLLGCEVAQTFDLMQLRRAQRTELA